MKKFFIVSAMVFSACCSPAPSQPQSQPETEVSTSPLSPKQAMYKRFVHAKVFSENCGDMMSFLEMSILQEMMFGLGYDLRETEGAEVFLASTAEIRDGFQENPGATDCSLENTANKEWRLDVLPEFYGSLLILMSDDKWNEQPLWVRGAAERMLEQFNEQYGFDGSAENTADIVQRRADFDSPAIAYDFLDKFLKAFWFQTRLEEKGYRLYPRAPVTETETNWAWTGIRSIETGNNYSGFFGPKLTSLRVQWRLLHLRSGADVSVLQGAGFDGRIRIIGVKDDPDSVLEMPARAVLLVQDKADVLARISPDWRAGTLRFEAEVQTGSNCPGDFCLTFPSRRQRLFLPAKMMRKVSVMPMRFMLVVSWSFRSRTRCPKVILRTFFMAMSICLALSRIIKCAHIKSCHV